MRSMSNASSDLFKVSAYLRKSVHEHPATESYSVEIMSEGHWRLALKRAREAAQLHALKGGACLAVGILTNILVAMPLMTALVAPAHAQAIPKSLSQSATAAALTLRGEPRPVGVSSRQ